MIKATILNKDYTIRNEWSDNTIKQMSKAHSYLGEIPQWLEHYLYSDEPSSISTSKLLKFYIDWIELFSDIPRDLLEADIKVEDANDVSLTFLFETVSKFLGEPSENEIGSSETIVLGKTTYTLIESVKTAGGVDKMLGGATYKHFAESQALANLYQQKKYRKWEYLSNITAILFRENPNEQYDDSLIEMRSKAFENLPVSEAYKGYFFLLNSLNSNQNSLVISLMEKKESLLDQSVKKSCSNFIGRIKPMKLLKRIFSLKKD